MKKLLMTVVGAACFMALMGGGVARASVITWFGQTDPSSGNATVSVNAVYLTNYGVAFKTGSIGPFVMDWVVLGLNTSSLTNGSASVKLSLRNTTNTTAYSALAGSTEYAVDTLNFSMPTTTSTDFTLNLTAANIPNISSYSMAADTAYSLIIYNANSVFGIQRHTGYASGATNNYYTVNEGFTALNTFHNNVTYSNNANSFPSLAISFGNTTAVPEPSTYALLCISLGVVGFARRRMVSKGSEG